MKKRIEIIKGGSSRRDLTTAARAMISIGLLLTVLASGVIISPALADESMDKMEMSEHEHHHHHMAASDTELKRSEADYKLPSLSLTRSDGVAVAFPQQIDDGRPVILNFIYTSCTAICPLTSQVFSQVQKKLAANGSKFHMVSISLDPEYDTPERLSAYAKTYQASPLWEFYTGSLDASIAVQKAFNAYRGNKMNHVPVTFLRAGPGKPWVRLDGFSNPDEVIQEYNRLIAATEKAPG